MRKLIVKYMHSSYRVIIAGKNIIFPRVMNVAVPMLLMLLLVLLKNKSYPALDLATWVVLLINIGIWAIAFCYLKLYPAKWAELDNLQKWFVGKSSEKLTIAQNSEWQHLDNKISARRYYNIFTLLTIPLSLLIFALLL